MLMVGIAYSENLLTIFINHLSHYAWSARLNDRFIYAPAGADDNFL